MEENENEENVPKNDEAPPVLMESNKINNFRDNNANLNNNMNNINLNSSNFNLLPYNINNNSKINENKQFQINNDKNIKSQIPLVNMNNPFPNNYQPYLIKNPIYPSYNMMYFNYFNQLQKNKINSNNNININQMPNKINQNSNDANPNLNDLKIDIEPEVLNLLSKENLIDIILYIRYFCQLKVDSKFYRINHKLFRLKKDKINGKGFLFYVKKRQLIEKLNLKDSNFFNNYENKINDNNSDSSDDSNENENGNIIKDQDFNNINLFGNPQYQSNYLKRYFYCEVHEKVYFDTDKKLHYAKHFKCPKCNLEFMSKKKLRTHNRIEHLEKEQNKSNSININNNSEKIEPLKNNNFNDIKNEEKIKCSDCNLFFNSVELMSSHYYEIHEKHKISKNIKKEKEKIAEEKKRLEELKRQEEEKKRKEELKRQEEEKKRLEELKRQEEEKKRLEELKRQEEEKKRLEELKRQEEEKKKLEEMKKKDEIKKVQILKSKEKNSKNNQYYYTCYLDKKEFYNEKSYVKHFIQFHKDDFPFYCDICRRGFWSYNSIEDHSRAKGHYK